MSLSSAQRSYDNQTEQTAVCPVADANPCQCGNVDILGATNGTNGDPEECVDYWLVCPVCKRESKPSGSIGQAIDRWNDKNPLSEA